MLFGTGRRARFILILFILCFGAETASSETLRQVLAAKNLPAPERNWRTWTKTSRVGRNSMTRTNLSLLITLKTEQAF